MHTWRIHRAQNRDRLAVHFRDFHDDLWVTNVGAEGFVELLLALLRSEPANMNAAGKRNIDTAVSVDTHGLISKFRQFGVGNLKLVARAKQVRGTTLVATVRLHFVGQGRRRNLSG